jgi:hypothetical protein
MGRRKYTDEELAEWEDRLVLKILGIVDMADEATVAAGRGWYDVGHAEIQILAHEYDVSVFRAAAIVAALSPLSRWAGNLEDAWRLFEGEKPKHSLPSNTVKARKIANGAPIGETLGGGKVRSFALNLARPSLANVATNDSHIGNALGIDLGDLFSVKGVYAMVTRAFVRAAEILTKIDGILWLAHQVQATLWLQAKITMEKMTAREREQYELPNPMEDYS